MVVQPRAAHRVVAIDPKAREWNAVVLVERLRRSPALRVAGHREVERHESRTEPPQQRHAAAIDRAAGAGLPAVRSLKRPEHAGRERVRPREPDAARAVSVPKRAAAGGDVSEVAPVGAREHLDHARERRDSVQRSLRPLHDLDPIDVLDRDLGQRRIERSSDGDAVERDQQRVELLEPPQADVGQPETVVRAFAGIDAHEILQRLAHGASPAPPQLDAGDDRRGVRDLLAGFGHLGRRDDDLVLERVVPHHDRVRLRGWRGGRAREHGGTRRGQGEAREREQHGEHGTPPGVSRPKRMGPAPPSGRSGDRIPCPAGGFQFRRGMNRGAPLAAMSVARETACGWSAPVPVLGPAGTHAGDRGGVSAEPCKTAVS